MNRHEAYQARLRQAELGALNMIRTRSATRKTDAELAHAIVEHVAYHLNGQHAIIITETGWAIEHPLLCLWDGPCEYQEGVRRWLAKMGRPLSAGRPVGPGRYRLEWQPHSEHPYFGTVLPEGIPN